MPKDLEFDSEYLLQQAIAKLLSRMPGVDDVTILHGAQECGKDIVFRAVGPLDDVLHCACVIKNHKISGRAGDNRGARVVLEQICQALENPYLDGVGNEVSIQRVYVMSPEQISQHAIFSIEKKLASRSGQVMFFGGSKLFDLFQRYWPDFFADEFEAVERYLRNLEAQATSSSLPGMANLYSLGEVDRREATIYVERSFHRSIHAYSFSVLLGELPGDSLLQGEYKRAEAEKLIHDIQILSKKVLHLKVWGYTTSLLTVDEIESVMGRFQDLLRRSWSDNAKKMQLAREGRVTRSVPSYISVALDGDGSFAAASKVFSQQISDWLLPVRILCRVTQQLPKLNISAPELLGTRLWAAASRFDDCLRSAPFKFAPSQEKTETTFSEGNIRAIKDDILIVGAAGYGKTSFCRRNCLMDARMFREGHSRVFPIYIPLHTIVGEQKSFEDAFLGGVGKSALLDSDLLRDAEAVRLYLDGLDEVPSESQQRKLIELARLHDSGGIKVQVILTARDYLYAEWLWGFRRIQLGTLTPREFSELKIKWLGAEGSLLESFDAQVSELPAIATVLKVPLLATLVMLVFRQKRALPESRTGLYETFCRVPRSSVAAFSTFFVAG